MVQHEPGYKTTVIMHLIMYPTAYISAQTWCLWFRFCKLLLVGYGNPGVSAG